MTEHTSISHDSHGRATDERDGIDEVKSIDKEESVAHSAMEVLVVRHS